MGGEAGGLTLQGLARRLEALERENAELRHKVTTLEGPGTRGSGDGEPASEFAGRVSRRSLLSKAGAAAVAAVAAGTLLNPREAKANHEPRWDDGILVESVVTHTVSATNDRSFAVRGINEGTGPGVEGENNGNRPAVIGNNKGSGPGVEGTSAGRGPGVKGRAKNGPGVRGDGIIGVWGSFSTNGQAGVYAENLLFGPGVVGDGHGENFAGVLGRNGIGHGVRGESRTQSTNFAGVRGIGSTGVWGSSSRTGYSGVYGQHTGSGSGVVGDGKGSGRAGVLGRNSSGTGVRGEGQNGVVGKSATTTGYGGIFEGGKAQLLLRPGASAGKHTGAHAKGEL